MIVKLQRPLRGVHGNQDNPTTANNQLLYGSYRYRATIYDRRALMCRLFGSVRTDGWMVEGSDCVCTVGGWVSGCRSASAGVCE
jgi:hypothetical protein